MKIGEIIKTNEKGQVVIPKKIREEVGITKDVPLNVLVRDGGVYITPVKSVNTTNMDDATYEETLKKTQGAWAEDAELLDKEREEQRKVELEAAKRGKEAW